MLQKEKLSISEKKMDDCGWSLLYLMLQKRKFEYFRKENGGLLLANTLFDVGEKKN